MGAGSPGATVVDCHERRGLLALQLSVPEVRVGFIGEKLPSCWVVCNAALGPGGVCVSSSLRSRAGFEVRVALQLEVRLSFAPGPVAGQVVLLSEPVHVVAVRDELALQEVAVFAAGRKSTLGCTGRAEESIFQTRGQHRRRAEALSRFVEV